MYVVEWTDREGNLHQLVFDSRERAEQEAAYLEQFYYDVAVVAEVTV